jgi:L-lactate utilization protein LutC
MTGSLFMRIYSRVARNPQFFRLAQKMAALGTRLAAPFSSYVRLPAVTGWGFSKDLPRFAGNTFRDRWNALETETGGGVGTAVNRHRGKDGEEGLGGEEIGEAADRNQEQLISSFAEELVKVGGQVTHTRPGDLTDRVIDFLHVRGIERAHLEPGLLDESALQHAGILTSHTPDPEIRVGVTGAICGLADTGSILVADGEGSPLQASLLPEIHIAILCASKILPSLRDAMQLPIVSRSRASVVITGPSRTADIEMSLTIGMHGPRELHVFLVDG